MNNTFNKFFEPKGGVKSLVRDLFESKKPVSIVTDNKVIESRIPKPVGKVQTNEECWVGFYNSLYCSKPELVNTSRETISIVDKQKVVEFNILYRDTTYEFAPEVMDCYRPSCSGTITKKGNNWYGYCDNKKCQAIFIFFKPSVYQEMIINNDIDTILLSLGGYGSGKTVASAAKVFRHMLEVRGASVLALAQTLEQVDKNAVTELIRFIPPKLIAKRTKNFIQLTNGSHIIFLASDKEDKIRGFNLTMAWGVEVNKIKYSVIEQLESRIRHENAQVFNLDSEGKKQQVVDSDGVRSVDVIKSYNQIILESNPDPSSRTLQLYWTRSTRFVATQTVKNPKEYIPFLTGTGKGFKVCTYLTNGFDNIFLSKDFKDNLNAKSDKVRKIYMDCDLSVKEGLVYPKYINAIVPYGQAPEIQPHWPRGFAADFGGGSGPTVLVAFACNPVTNVWYVYDIYSKVDSSVAAHVDGFINLIFGNSNTYKAPWPIMFLVGDPKGNTREVGNTETVFEQYARYGISFTKANNSKGSRQLDTNGITITNDLMEIGKLKIISNEKTQLLIKQMATIAYKVQPAKGLDEGKILDVIEVTPFRDDEVDATRYASVEINKLLKNSNALPIISVVQKMAQNSSTINTYNGRVSITGKSYINVSKRHNLEEPKIYVPKRGGK